MLTIFLFPIKIELEYSRHKQDDQFKLNIYLFKKIPGLKLKIPFLQNFLFPFLTRIKAEISSVIFKLCPGKKEIELEEEIHLQEIQLENIKKSINLLLDKKQMALVFSSLNLSCKKFYWETNYGFSNPALTGISNGLIWTLKLFILKKIKKNICSLHNPEIEVNPNFSNSVINIRFHSIFSVKLGNIILTGIKLYLYRVKGGFGFWKNKKLKS